MSCDWPIDRTCLPALPDLPDNPTTEQQEAYALALSRQNAAEDLAVGVLWALSGRQFGACETTARPCPNDWTTQWGMGPFLSPYVRLLDSGFWVDSPCGCGSGACVVSGPRVVHLPGPVAAIVSVTIAGVVLDASGYQLEGDALYRKGGASWPRQDLGRPLGENGTWSVTYTRGLPVPPGVDRLAGILAKEFISACGGGGSCRLPKTVVSTTQRGVTHVFDPSKILAAGKTGLSEVDQWLAAVNPNHLLAAPSVL